MDCGCIKEKYTPYLEVISPFNMIYRDFSIWMEGSDFSDETFYDLEVYSPYYDETNIIPNVSSLNGKSISNKDIGFDNEIRDDVYCFRVNSCNKTYKKNLFFYGNAQCTIDTLIARDDDRYLELQRLVDRIKVSVNRDNFKVAEQFLSNLKEKVKSINCGNCP